MLLEIVKVIGPAMLIIGAFYYYINKKTDEKIEEFQKERELLEKLRKQKEDNFTIEFEENPFIDIEEYVRKNEDKYKPNNEQKEENTEKTYNKKSYFDLKKEYEKKGRDYELNVKNYYERLGYEVIDNSKIKGKKDEGIDLIAINKNNSEYLCIQCKNWEKRKINYNHIKQFLSDYILYLKKHKDEVKIYKKRKFILAIPDKILTKAAYARIKENNDIIDFQIIKKEGDK